MKAFNTKTAAVFSMALFCFFFVTSAAIPQSAEIHPKKHDANLYGYVDANDKWVIEPRFMAANPFLANGSAWVQLGKGKYGSIDKTGKIQLALTPDVYEFESVSPAGAVVARAVVKPEEYYPFYGLVSEKGWIVKPEHHDIKAFSEKGLFQATEGRGKSSFLLNEKGATVMKFNGNIVKRFNDVIVGTLTKDGHSHYGIVDMKGKWIVKPELNIIFSDERSDYATFVDSNGKCGVIDGNGKIIVKPLFSNIQLEPFAHADLTAASDSNGKYGFIDKSGEWVIKPQFHGAENFSKNGLAGIDFSDGEYGFINTKGEIVIAPKFIDGYDFDDNGYARVQASDGKWGVIKENGEWAVQPRHDDIIHDSQIVDGTALFFVEDNGRVGLINAKGDWIVKPSWFDFGRFDKRGYCEVQTESSQYGFIDSKGKWLIKPIYYYLEPFGDNDYAVALAPGKHMGLIDRQGKFVLEPVFSEISMFGDYLVKVIFENDSDLRNYHYLNLRGEARVPVGYDPKREK
ncbi:MAG: WG repeat-containing protein [Deltaproteobacteria bacterium]|jgi:hypothetical protein|nr:WG repeat-containing protein [Deltaproteobacteria bacterium]